MEKSVQLKIMQNNDKGKIGNQGNPIRVAWTDHGSSKSDEHVEVIARRITEAKSKFSNRVAWKTTDAIESRVNLSSKKTLNLRKSNFAEKAIVLCSKEELTERLKLAWKHREKNRRNINIFLAHHAPDQEEPIDSDLENEGSNLIRKEREEEEEATKSLLTNRFCSFGYDSKEKGEGWRRWWWWWWWCWSSSLSLSSSSTSSSTSLSSSSSLRSTMNVPDLDHMDNIICEIQSKYIEDLRLMDSKEYENDKTSEISVKKSCVESEESEGMEEKEGTKRSKEERTMEEGAWKKGKLMTNDAKEKRANFQSGSNKAFLVPMMIDIVKTDKGEKPKRRKSAPPEERAGILRSLNNSRTRGKEEKVAALAEGVKENEEKEKTVSVGGGKVNVNGERSIKSAPFKRRSKSKRRSSIFKEDFQQEAAGNCVRDQKDRAPRNRQARHVPQRGKDLKMMDVVTMVSLVSSADSDSEEENSPSDHRLINELRNKLPTTPIIKNPDSNSNPISATFRSIRRPLKSVSFQNDSFDDSNTKEESSQRTTNSQYKTRGKSSSSDNGSNGIVTGLSIKDIDQWTSEMETFSLLSFLRREDPPLDLEEAEKTRTGKTDDAHTSENKNESEVENEANDVAAAASSSTIPLMDREKRCLAVPIADMHDKKRKLVRIRGNDMECRSSEFVKEAFFQRNSSKKHFQEKHAEQQTAQSAIFKISKLTETTITRMVETSTSTSDSVKSLPPSEFNCQTNKEKECWHLYRRMCDKGVYISFDTVLRGMLTPTEYRLRQKQLSQEV